MNLPNQPETGRCCQSDAFERLLFGLALTLGLIAQGCALSKPAIVPQSFTFLPSVEAIHRQPALEKVLALRKVQIQPPFNTQSLTYRTGDYSFEQDPYAQFLGPPAESLAAALRSTLRQSGTFANVTEPGSLLPAQVELEVYVEKFYGDFRNRQEPRAVLSARFVFFDAQAATGRDVILDHEYNQELTLSAPTAAALVAGWNQALGRITSQAIQDVRGALLEPPADHVKTN